MKRCGFDSKRGKFTKGCGTAKKERYCSLTPGTARQEISGRKKNRNKQKRKKKECAYSKVDWITGQGFRENESREMTNKRFEISRLIFPLGAAKKIR